MKGWPALLGGLGLVGVGFGLLSLVVQLFLYDPVRQDLAESLFGWVSANLLVGVLLLTGSLFMAFDQVRDRLRSDEGRRIGRHGVSAIVSALLSLAILGGLGFLSTRYHLRFDVSDDQVNTLTSQTRGLLERLDEPIELTAFFAETEAPTIAELLGRYDYQSDQVSLEFLEPNAVPGLVEDLQLDPEALARGLLRISRRSGEAVVVTEFGESEITNAILKLTRESGKQVYFVSGHNERPIADQDGQVAGGKESVGRAAEALRNETYAVDSIGLATIGDVPEDADVLVIAGPTQPLLDHELEVLRRYVARGGALMVMLDPRSNTNLYADLAAWGVRLGDDVVVDRSLALFGQATSPFAGQYAEDHPITSEMTETALFPMVRSVLVDLDSELEVIVSTGGDSWAERDLDGWRRTGRAVLGDEDLAGPVPIAAAGLIRATPPGAGDEADSQEAGEGGEDAAGTADSAVAPARIVVFGDSDFASNEFLDSFRNKDLFLNSINWLLGDIEQISLRPNTAQATRHRLSVDDFENLQSLSLFLVPELIAVIGVFAWWWRRDSAER